MLVCHILWKSTAKEVERVGRDGLPARVNIYYNSYNFSKARKNMSEAMRAHVQSKECKRKLILNYFDHEVPKDQPQDHTRCDFHSTHCQCKDCMLINATDQVQVLNVQKQMTPTEQYEGNPLLFCSEANQKNQIGHGETQISTPKSAEALHAMWLYWLCVHDTKKKEKSQSICRRWQGHRNS